MPARGLLLKGLPILLSCIAVANLRGVHDPGEPIAAQTKVVSEAGMQKAGEVTQLVGTETVFECEEWEGAGLATCGEFAEVTLEPCLPVFEVRGHGVRLQTRSYTGRTKSEKDPP